MPQLKVPSSLAALSCSLQFVIVLATLEFQFIAFEQTIRPVLLVEKLHARCVGFSWAKPSVTKRATHPSVYRVETTLAVLLQRLQRPVGILGKETA